MSFRLYKLGPLFLLFAGIAVGQGPQPIGTVGVQDATVAGVLEITNGRAILVGSTTVTAHDHLAEVALSRGGFVRVCATSGLHVAGGAGATGERPLMLGLDRGAIEVQMAATTHDVVMTPDLRFTLGSDGPLDLNLRVMKNGDTCVENRGVTAPVLHIADPFGAGAYDLLPGQHVLFEHASLKEVVDHESSSCGCPPEPPSQPTMNLADALVKQPASSANEATAPSQKAAAEHPFPAAVSEGLAPAAVVPQVPEGALHSQVSATLSTGGAPDSTAEPVPSAFAVSRAADAATASSSAAATIQAVPPAQSSKPASPPHKGVLHAVGHFFRRVFGGG